MLHKLPQQGPERSPGRKRTLGIGKKQKTAKTLRVRKYTLAPVFFYWGWGVVAPSSASTPVRHCSKVVDFNNNLKPVIRNFLPVWLSAASHRVPFQRQYKFSALDPQSQPTPVPPPLFRRKFENVLWDSVAEVGAPRSEDPKLIIVQVNRARIGRLKF